MGTKDIKSNEYLADNSRFADLFNYKLYDAINYEKQLKEAANIHIQNRDKMSSAEFLSKFKSTDRLTPIITLTLYWGADEWNAPTHLHQMFGEMDEHLKQFIPNYHINLVSPNQIQSFEKFKTELGRTLEFIKYSADTQHFKIMLSNLKNQKLSNETVSVINSFTGANIKLNEQSEVTDVCLAIEEIKLSIPPRNTSPDRPLEITSPF